jgi:MFS family permease
MKNNIKIKRIYLLSFLFTLHISISAYVNSTFLTDIINEKFVGILYTTASLVTLILLSKSSKFLGNFGNRKTTLFFLVLNMISLVGLSFSHNPYLIGLSFLMFTVTNTLIFFCIDIFIEHFSDKEKTGRIRGLYLTIINLAWIISPMLTALIVKDNSQIRIVYFISLVMVSLATLGIILFTKKFKDGMYKKTPFLKTLINLKNNKSMNSIVAINFLLQFFYALMVIYTPIYLSKHIGLTWMEIGIIFTVMLSPFVILGLPIGILIDKYKLNKKHLLNIGFIFAILSTAFIPFIDSKNILIWALVLFGTRVGASLIETTSEIYFFSKIDDKDAEVLGLYRNMNSLAYIIAPILTTILFLFMPFEFIFIVISTIMILGFYFIKRLKENNIIKI